MIQGKNHPPKPDTDEQQDTYNVRQELKARGQRDECCRRATGTGRRFNSEGSSLQATLTLQALRTKKGLESISTKGPSPSHSHSNRINALTLKPNPTRETKSRCIVFTSSQNDTFKAMLLFRFEKLLEFSCSVNLNKSSNKTHARRCELISRKIYFHLPKITCVELTHRLPY